MRFDVRRASCDLKREHFLKIFFFSFPLFFLLFSIGRRLPPIEDMVVKHPELGICLVDHQQKTQMNPSIENNRVLGIIDHHALQEAGCTARI